MSSSVSSWWWWKLSVRVSDGSTSLVSGCTEQRTLSWSWDSTEEQVVSPAEMYFSTAGTGNSAAAGAPASSSHHSTDPSSGHVSGSQFCPAMSRTVALAGGLCCVVKSAQDHNVPSVLEFYPNSSSLSLLSCSRSRTRPTEEENCQQRAGPGKV